MRKVIRSLFWPVSGVRKPASRSGSVKRGGGSSSSASRGRVVPAIGPPRPDVGSALRAPKWSNNNNWADMTTGQAPMAAPDEQPTSSFFLGRTTR